MSAEAMTDNELGIAAVLYDAGDTGGFCQNPVDFQAQFSVLISTCDGMPLRLWNDSTVNRKGAITGRNFVMESIFQ